MSLLLAIMGAGGNWSGATWADRFTKRLPGRTIGLWPDESIDLAGIKYAAVWKPPPGLLARCPSLEVIFNLGAGVDALLGDPTLPRHVPLVRVANIDLTKRMTEYVALHVLDAPSPPAGARYGSEGGPMGSARSVGGRRRSRRHHGARRTGARCGRGARASGLSGARLEPFAPRSAWRALLCRGWRTGRFPRRDGYPRRLDAADIRDVAASSIAACFASSRGMGCWAVPF